jgi:hypothetical protein
VTALMVDGLVYTSSVVMLEFGAAGVRVPMLARWLLGLGIAATLAANVAHGLGCRLIGASVAAWPSVVLASRDRRRAKAGRKRDASRDGVILDAARLPDTGSLRGDMTAMILPLDDQQQVRIQAMAGLLSLAKADQRLAEAAVGGEYPRADIGTLAEIIPMMCVARAVQRLPITREFSIALVDGVIIPPLRGSG